MIRFAYTDTNARVIIMQAKSKNHIEKHQDEQLSDLANGLGRTISIIPLSDAEYYKRIGIPDGVTDLIVLPDDWVSPDREKRSSWVIRDDKIVIKD